jgi:hypothetical protein
MIEPIGAPVSRYVDRPDLPEAQASAVPIRTRRPPWEPPPCRNAEGVIEGFLCRDPKVVSDACRRATSGFDAFVCDEPRMKRLEDSIVRETWTLMRTLLISWVLRRIK